MAFSAQWSPPMRVKQKIPNAAVGMMHICSSINKAMTAMRLPQKSIAQQSILLHLVVHLFAALVDGLFYLWLN